LTSDEQTALDRLKDVMDMLSEEIVFVDRSDRVVFWNVPLRGRPPCERVL